MTFTGLQVIMIAWASASIGAFIGAVVMGLVAAGKREDDER